MLSIVALVLCIQSAAAGWYTKSNVIELGARNFKRDVINNDNVTVVQFYTSSPECKEIASEYKRSAKTLNGIVRVGAVNCERPENKGICDAFGANEGPVIKVFQPGKKTDSDFKLVNKGDSIDLKEPRVFTYDGLLTGKALNTFAIAKLRNYVATLDQENSFVWFKSTGVPKVVMLPGAKYKSKSIAPLFKVLSNEYFGRLRFAYIPRRVDGAWNLLGIKAPDESQLVYMSEDQRPFVYNGIMKKKDVCAFVSEQYKLEMGRRVAKEIPLFPEGNAAAFGLEWVVEDAQLTDMEHVLEQRRQAIIDDRDLKYNMRQVRERIAKEKAEEAGEEYIPQPLKPEEDPSAPIEVKRKNLTSDDLAEIEVGSVKLPKFDFDAVAEEVESGEVVEEGEADIDDADDANIEEAPEAMLDEVDVEYKPEDLLDDSPEAVAKYRKSISEQKAKYQSELAVGQSARAELLRSKLSKEASLRSARGEEMPTPVKPLPPGITPDAAKATVTEHHEDDSFYRQRLQSVDDIVGSCVRRKQTCVLLSSHSAHWFEDLRVLLAARAKLPAKVNKELHYFFYVEDENEEVTQFDRDIEVKHTGTRKDKSGNTINGPGVVTFNFDKNRYTINQNLFTAQDVARFIGESFRKTSASDKDYHLIPRKYHLWITPDDIELLDKLESMSSEEASETASVKDEL